MELIYLSCPLAPGNKAILVLNTPVCPYVAFKREIPKIAHFRDNSSGRRFHHSADTPAWDRAAPLLIVFLCVLPWPQQEELLGRLFGREGPRGSAAWEDASVRSAWLKGVQSMVHHQPALLLLCSTGECSWGCHPPHTCPLLRCHMGKVGVFV